MKAILIIEDKPGDNVTVNLEFDPPLKLADAKAAENESIAAHLAFKALNYLIGQRDEGTEPIVHSITKGDGQ